VLQTPRGPIFSIAQRAEHIWESMSSATTRSRPIINTRDEPHADAEMYRRLHVIVGDSNMSEYTTYLKLGSTACMLRMIESEDVSLRDLSLENPVRAIRDFSHDITCRKKVRLESGRELSALDIQREYLNSALKFADTHGFTPSEMKALEMWEHCVSTIENDPLKLGTEVDWVIKHNLIEAFRSKHGLALDDARVQTLDLQYHDIRQDRGVFYRLQARSMVDRICDEQDIVAAMDIAPQTTRARLRSEFIIAAKEKKRDYTVDWVHLKINDQAQKTVLCKDPFVCEDDRVEKLIASL
jgi:proteasome accessory factor A